MTGQGAERWTGTLRQSFPRLFEVLRQMRPTFQLESILLIDPAFVRAHRVAGIIWDVDGTLMRHHGSRVMPELQAAFNQLLAVPGLRHVVLSNASERRFRELGEIFPEIPCLRAYTSGAGILYRRLLRGADSWSADELQRRLAAGARAIRKPSRILVDCAVRELGCSRREALLVGDQYATDISGANMGGVRSIKVLTVARESFPPPVRLLQRLEQLAYGVLHRP